MANTPNPAPVTPVVPTKTAAPVVPTPKPVVKDAKAPVVETKPSLKPASESTKTVKTPEAEPLDTYVINGKEVQLTKTQAKTYIQKAGALDARMRELADREKKAQALVEDFENDPEAALKKLGKDPQKIIDSYLQKMAKQATLTPEQLEKQHLEQELADFKAKDEAAKKEQLTLAQKQMFERDVARWQQRFVTVAQNFELGGSPDTLEQLAAVSIEFGELGINLSDEQLAAEVKYRREEHVNARDAQLIKRFPNTDEGNSALVDYLGKDVVKRVIRATLKAVPKPEAKAIETGTPVQTSVSKNPTFNNREFKQAVRDAQSIASKRNGTR